MTNNGGTDIDYYCIKNDSDTKQILLHKGTIINMRLDMDNDKIASRCH